MSAPKNDGTEWFILTEGSPTTLPCLALPVPNNGVILAISNSAIYLPHTALEGDPETGYHLKSTICRAGEPIATQQAEKQLKNLVSPHPQTKDEQ